MDSYQIIRAGFLRTPGSTQGGLYHPKVSRQIAELVQAQQQASELKVDINYPCNNSTIASIPVQPEIQRNTRA